MRAAAFFLWASAALAQMTGGGSGSSGGGWEVQFTVACQNTVAAHPFSVGSSGAPTANCAASNITNTVAWATLDWSDAGGLTAYGLVNLPTSSTAIKADFWIATSGTVVDQVRFELATACVASGGAPDPSYNTAQPVWFTPSGTAERPVKTSISAVTVTGCTAGTLMRFKITRVTDDNAQTAKLWRVRFYLQ